MPCAATIGGPPTHHPGSHASLHQRLGRYWKGTTSVSAKLIRYSGALFPLAKGSSSVGIPA